jgi:prepilin-type N-terminal cleavage/methylation domain-containing protein
MKKSLRQRGYTLVELMIVVSIIAVMAAGIAPAITTAMYDGRAANAASDLVRLGGRARAEATFTGLAHLLSYSRDATNLGQVRLARGVNNRCNLQGWGAATPVVDGVLMITYNAADSRSHVIDLQPESGVAALDICYQPDGSMLTRTGTGLFAAPNGALRFTITHTISSTAQGVVRKVLFPYGGVARLDI